MCLIFAQKRNRNGDAKGSQDPAVYGPGKGRSWTTSLAIPGNIIDMYVQVLYQI